jgi:phospholipid/cholesterol/gamma-HCH transport system ATP-binding protein
MQTPLVEFKDVTKRFDTRTILDHVNLEIYEGDVTTIIGKSGTGKSVLLKHIIGLLGPTEGNILFQGKPIHTMRRKELDGVKRQISYCFQNNALFDSLTVFENIALPLQQTTGMSKKEIEKKVMEKIEQLELSEVPHKYPSEISGGMQKRAALARALITDPRIVLFDEPTTGQDPIRKNAILGMIAQNQKKYGFTTIMISHEIPDVFFISDRIIILYDGQVIFQGTPGELDQLDHPMVDEFVKSLEGFQDELTGLSSKKSFTKLYEEDVKQKKPDETIMVAMFTLDDLDGVSENLGYTQAQEIVQYLGVHVNKHFGAVGISTRVGRDRMVTILPNTDRNTAERMLEDFAKELQSQGLGEIHSEAQAVAQSEACYTFSVSAGLAEGTASEDIEDTSERATANLRTIGHFQC